ncbi:MAG: glutamate-cysteine ligase family protein [Proteobacteria bacterium]|nr:glutamate-cysteine ligase family protein [Pseudomonadota bacterium]
MIAPFSGAVFNYSGISAMAPTGMTGLRSKIWRHMDPSRTGVPPLAGLKSRLDKEACVQTYFDFLMAARVVFVTGLDYKVMNKPTTWSQWMEQGIDGIFPDEQDFETHLSLLFPEVRARGFLELRSVDCQSRVWQFVPAAWWTGLLYDDAACEQVIELLLPFESRMTELLDAAPQGLQHPILAEYSKKLIKIASEGLSRLPPCYFEQGELKNLHTFAEHFTLQGRVPAQDMLDEVLRIGKLVPSSFKRVGMNALRINSFT